jgi:hypothetical protein
MKNSLIKSFCILFIIIIVALYNCTPDFLDETPPECVIIYPVDGQAVSGTVKIIVAATDNEEVDKVYLYIDDENIAISEETLFEYSWETTAIADNQDHSIHAIAYDKDDNAGFSGQTLVRLIAGTIADTLAPVIEIIHPVSGTFVRNVVPVLTYITDDSQILKVEYYVDGLLLHTANQAPFNFNWDVSVYPVGSDHSLFAKAFDQNNNVTVSQIITVTIGREDNTAPDITIMYPVNGSFINVGTVLNISVDATDENGIQKVEFYIDGEFKATDTQIPYTYRWDTSGLTPGSDHSIFAKAYDTEGNTNSQLIFVAMNP